MSPTNHLQSSVTDEKLQTKEHLFALLQSHIRFYEFIEQTSLAFPALEPQTLFWISRLPLASFHTDVFLVPCERISFPFVGGNWPAVFLAVLSKVSSTLRGNVEISVK